MVKVWIFIAIVGGTPPMSGFIIDNLATVEDCQRIQQQFQSVYHVRGRCVEVWKNR